MISPNKLQRVLIDRRSYAIFAPLIIEKMKGATYVGIDLETQDANRHEGLNEFMRVDEEGSKAKNRPLVFDVNRTVITGLSIYIDGDDTAYYFNLAHADFHNTLKWEEVKAVLDAKNEDANWIAHNLEFELTMLSKCVGYHLSNAIDTLQLAVSAYGPDEYDIGDFLTLGIEPIKHLILEASSVFADYNGQRDSMTGAQGELFKKFISKESDAAHSYNGWVDTIGRPYGLKACVKYWFNYQMDTFEETLGDSVHMGQLTGEQVVFYGCDDSYWAVRLYHKLIEYISVTNPSALTTYFEQELPCVYYYSDFHQKGVRINLEAVRAKRIEERVTYAQVLRDMKAAIRQLLPFDTERWVSLEKYDGQPPNGKKRAGWYFNGAAKYRGLIEKWAYTKDADDFTEAQRVRGAVSIAWAHDEGKPEPTGLSIAHYMPVRVLMYDLLRQKVIVEKGKVQSDGESRGKLKERIEQQIKELGPMASVPDFPIPDDDSTFSGEGEDWKEYCRLKASLKLLECMGHLASIEQRAKLYLNPYLQLTDPETGRVYPTIQSMLASRRTSVSNPNGQQLAKRGESTYIRGFYEADE